MSAGADSEISTVPQLPAPSPKTRRKPRFALFVATACGLGYLPKAPGTWGSLAGVLIYYLIHFYFPLRSATGSPLGLGARATWISMTVLPIAILIAVVGVLTANSVERYSGAEDPQFVVIDEVSGQLFAYMFG